MTAPDRQAEAGSRALNTNHRENARVSALTASARMEGQMLIILELQGFTALEHLVHRALQRVAASHPSLLEQEGWIQ